MALLVFWEREGTEKIAGDHPHTQGGRQERMHQLLGRLSP